MTETVLESLSRALAPFPREAPLVAGFSGGLDSTVLAEALLRAGEGRRTRLVHVDHGLHPDSRRWSRHCADFAASRGLAFHSLAVRVPASGNLEEQARIRRRAALLECLPPDGVLLLAHHGDDQAETLLLRLMRGSGVHGLASMRACRRERDRWVLRPFLELARPRLLRVARTWGLEWIEDPANADQGFDRSFLRKRVMPVLSQRWPDAGERLRAAADRLAAAGELLDERASEDLRRCSGCLDYLELAPFRDLSPARRRNLLHWWLRQRGLRFPGRRALARLETDLLEAGADRHPRIRWREGCFTRFRDRLYLLSPRDLEAPAACLDWWPGNRPEIDFGVGVLASGRPEDECEHYPLTLSRAAPALRVTTARGGERLYTGGMHRRVVELWRRHGVPPWRRTQLPLFYADDVLVAVAGAGVADGWRPGQGEQGWSLYWMPGSR